MREAIELPFGVVSPVAQNISLLDEIQVPQRKEAWEFFWSIGVNGFS